jgi:rare lipoprotein A (peptidoglycan hydrolase)
MTSRTHVNAAPPAYRRPWGPAFALVAGLVYGGLVLVHPSASSVSPISRPISRISPSPPASTGFATAAARLFSRHAASGAATVSGAVLRGQATWYGPGFQGSPTASGEPYDMEALTAAHPTLPLGSHARVTNLDNGKSVVVRINDRGPFTGRMIDLSRAAAREIRMLGPGSARVEVTPLGD